MRFAERGETIAQCLRVVAWHAGDGGVGRRGRGVQFERGKIEHPRDRSTRDLDVLHAPVRHDRRRTEHDAPDDEQVVVARGVPDVPDLTRDDEAHPHDGDDQRDGEGNRHPAWREEHRGRDAGTGDDASANESVPCTLDGEDITVAFNPSYLSEGLAVVDQPQVRFAFTSAPKPALLTGVNQEDGVVSDYRYLVMPVRIA